MSISIRNDGLAEASQATRAAQVAPSGRPGQTTQGLNSTASDRIDISSLAERVGFADRAQAAQQTERVSKLTALYQSGGYRVDSLNLSRAMVSSALNAGSMGI